MSYEHKLERFADFIGKITAASGCCGDYDDWYEVLSVIYDYGKLNDYGKIIYKYTKMDTWWGEYVFDAMKINKIRIAAAKEFADKLTYTDKLRFYFIFAALLVLTVDDSDKEEKYSEICDFARMLNITDDEVLDIVHVIKVLYNIERRGGSFRTKTVPNHFKAILDL